MSSRQFSQQLITKYRPKVFSEVVGNAELLRVLTTAMKSEFRPHGYLFTGISGVGKTSLARIVGTEIDAHILEMDAASYSGVDDTRALVEISAFMPITGESSRLFIIDECHNLSAKGWQPLLGLIEEPPPFIYVALCTTDPTNIPATIKSRCFTVPLKPLTTADLSDYIADIAEREGWTVDDDVLMSIVVAAKGSPRVALSLLQMGHDAQSVGELARIIPQELIPRELQQERDLTVERLNESIARLRYLQAKENK